MKKVLFAAVLLVMAAAGYTEEFGFTLGGESSEAVLIRSEKTVSQKATEEGVTETRTVWFDPKTEIKVERVAHRYDDFPALDYTIYITNTGSGKSPVLADFRAYDGVLLRSKGNVKLHWDRGGINSPRAFEPMVDILGDSDKTVVRDVPAPEVACDDTLYGAAHYNPFMGKGSDRGYTVQRYKGLDEMSDEQLWQTTMNPANRRLRKITIDNAIQAERTFSMLMGDDVPPRRQFIEENAHYANIDA